VRILATGCVIVVSATSMDNKTNYISTSFDSESEHSDYNVNILEFQQLQKIQHLME
jgi:hypothetical protein